MIERFKRYTMPRTVDQAVDILISDLSTQQMYDVSCMTDGEFDQMCTALVPYLQHDFHLWSGNDDLLMDALDSVADAVGTDPMRIIMDRLRDRLCANIGVVIVTE